jgi:ribosomal protein S18 acetylase RimI-like enzyme
MHIEKVSEVTEEIYEAVRRLVPLLGVHKPKPSRDDLERLVNSGTSTLLIARFPDETSSIAGMLTIAFYRVPTGGRSIVEDLVVAEEFRGMGIAKALLLSAIDVARELGASGVTLTSRPDRVEANHLYVRMGFKKRETNAYIFPISRSEEKLP